MKSQFRTNKEYDCVSFGKLKWSLFPVLWYLMNWKLKKIKGRLNNTESISSCTTNETNIDVVEKSRPTWCCRDASSTRKQPVKVWIRFLTDCFSSACLRMDLSDTIMVYKTATEFKNIPTETHTLQKDNMLATSSHLKMSFTTKNMEQCWAQALGWNTIK